MSCIRPWGAVGWMGRLCSLSTARSDFMFRVFTYLAALFYAGTGVLCVRVIPSCQLMYNDLGIQPYPAPAMLLFWVPNWLWVLGGVIAAGVLIVFGPRRGGRSLVAWSYLLLLFFILALPVFLLLPVIKFDPFSSPR